MPSENDIQKSLDKMTEHAIDMRGLITEYIKDNNLDPGEISALLRLLAAECEWIAVTTFEDSPA